MSTNNSYINEIILFTAIGSSVVAILTIVIAIFVLLHVTSSKKQKISKHSSRDSVSRIITLNSIEKRQKRWKRKQRSNKTGKTPSDSASSLSDHSGTRVEIRKYFTISSSCVVIFNSLCSIFNALYCISLMSDPPFDDTIIYYKHNSYYLRIVSTVCWYLGTIAVIWFFNGRLFYAFKGSVFASSKRLFRFINVFVSIFGITSLVAAYCSVYLQKVVFAEISFTSFRITYQIITFILLFMFSRRLLLLTMRGQTTPIIQETIPSNSKTGTKQIQMMIHSESISGKTTNTPIKSTDIDIRCAGYAFLQVTARNSVLVFITSTSVALVTIGWSSFRWIFTPPSRVTLLIPMNMASVDSLIGSVSIIMLFPFGKNFYNSLCCCCHKCFTFICVRIAKSKIIQEINTLYLDELGR